MITCKEDLMNTWIENDNGELTKAYLEACSKFGLVTKGDGNKATMETFMLMENIGVCKDDGAITCSDFWDYSENGCKQLTIDDMKREVKKEKPTPTKFVKVEESIFDLREEFERGELYAVNGREKHFVINNEGWLTNAKSNGNVYRQVKVDWRDEMAEFTGLGKSFYTWIDCIDNMYDFDFVEMCHKVASLTEKPEDV